MQSTVDITELDDLVRHLETEIDRVEVHDNAETLSLLLCSGGCGGGWSWYWYC